MKSTTTYMFTGENISDGESFEIVRTKDLDYMSQLILYHMHGLTVCVHYRENKLIEKLYF